MGSSLELLDATNIRKIEMFAVGSVEIVFLPYVETVQRIVFEENPDLRKVQIGGPQITDGPVFDGSDARWNVIKNNPELVEVCLGPSLAEDVTEEFNPVLPPDSTQCTGIDPSDSDACKTKGMCGGGLESGGSDTVTNDSSPLSAAIAAA